MLVQNDKRAGKPRMNTFRGAENATANGYTAWIQLNNNPLVHKGIIHFDAKGLIGWPAIRSINHDHDHAGISPHVGDRDHDRLVSFLVIQ